MEDLSVLRVNRQRAESVPSREHTAEEVTAMYNRHVDTVYRVCFSLMGNPADAEDGTQAVFLKLTQSSKPFADAEHEKAWLITTARNYCRDVHRQWWRRKVIGIDQVAERADAAANGQDAIWDELMRLPPRLRILLYLHYYEGYKLAEIGAMLKMNVNTVKTQIRTAKHRLRIELGDDDHA